MEALATEQIRQTCWLLAGIGSPIILDRPLASRSNRGGIVMLGEIVQGNFEVEWCKCRIYKAPIPKGFEQLQRSGEFYCINYLLIPKPPKALSSSSPSLLACGTGVCCRPDASALETSTSIRFPLAFPAWVGGFVLLSGSNNLASLSNQPGATLLFSASSLAAMASSHAFNSLSASSRTFWIYACNALHDAIISSGCAA